MLLKLVEREQPLLVILGKQGIDDDNGQTGQILAALSQDRVGGDVYDREWAGRAAATMW